MQITSFDLIVLLKMIFLVSTLMACSPQPTPHWEALLSHCPSEQEIGRLLPRDRIEIHVYGEEQMSGEYEISPAGTIDFPLVGVIHVQGLRSDEVAALIREKLKEHFLRNPSVRCSNKNIYRTAVSVDGAVRQPGSVAFREGLMLTDAIANSGGLTLRADGHVIIMRKDQDHSLSVVVPYRDIVQAKAKNICLHPGDVIYVPESSF